MNSEESGEIVEVRCTNCGNVMYIFKNRVKERMFCTIKCMEKYSTKHLPKEQEKS